MESKKNALNKKIKYKNKQKNIYININKNIKLT